MTAASTLQPSSLSGAQDGFTITVAEARTRVQARTSRSWRWRPTISGPSASCWALLIPSGSNITQMLAAQVAPVSSRHRPDVTQSLQQEKR
jgi:hypothetical protein